jgi:GAF domain-containing protein
MYDTILQTIRSICDTEANWVALTANASAVLFYSLPDINWAGFYFLVDGRLVAGPFQGKPACSTIELSKGVCGHAATTRKTVIVPDVHLFKGHIACDSASQSEIVVPLIRGQTLSGVLDIDSPIKNRFTKNDAIGLERVARLIAEKLPQSLDKIVC